MESCENIIVPPPFPLDYRNLVRYLPKEPEDQPLDFTIKKPPVSNSRFVTSPVSESTSARSDSPEHPLKLLPLPYAGMDPSAMSYLQMNLLGLSALPPSNVQSGKKESSKRKSSKDLRPHQVAEQLIQQPIHRPRNIFPSDPVPLHTGGFSLRSGLDATSNGELLSYGPYSSLSDKIPYMYNGRSPFAYDLPYSAMKNGVSPRNGLSSPRSGLPSSHLSSPERASSPSKQQSPSSPKRDHDFTHNSLHNGLPSSKRGVTSSLKGLLKGDSTHSQNGLSKGDSTSPHNGLSSSKGLLEGDLIPSPKGDSPRNDMSSLKVGVTSSHNGPSSSKVGVDSSQNGLSSSKGDPTSSYNGLSSSPDGTPSTTGQSTDRSQTEKAGLSSPDGRFSPLSSELGRSSPITSSDVVDSSSGGCKRKKGNPVPESAKDSAYMLKRLKNNVAAKKSREKRREHEAQLTQKVNELHVTNRELKAENDRLYFEGRERNAELWRLEKQLEAEREARARVEEQLKELRRNCGRCSELFRA